MFQYILTEFMRRLDIWAIIAVYLFIGLAIVFAVSRAIGGTMIRSWKTPLRLIFVAVCWLPLIIKDRIT